MKKIYFLLFLVSLMTNAQIVNIPDVNFKARLLAADANNSSTAGVISADGTYYILGATIDLNGDHEISVAEAQSIQYLNVLTHIPTAGLTITDLTGIEAFTNLDMLNFSGNSVSNFDLSALTHLKSLSCSNNQIASLDLHIFPNLVQLNCAENQISTLDFSGLEYLESVNCSSNQLTSLDFHANPNFYDLGCGNNNLASINVQNGRMHNTIFGIMQCDGWYNNAALTSICADANEIASVQLMIDYMYPQNNIQIVECLLSTHNNLSENASIIYPNPTSGIVTIKSHAMQSMELYDIQGRLLQTFLGSQDVLDITNQANGIYFLKITTDKGSKVEKLVKK